MAKYPEDTLKNWTKPPSDTEQSKLDNSERMVREAINSDDILRVKSTETFAQGSYANNTNVRLNSDIDINVCYTDGFYFKLPQGKNREDFGLNSPSEYSYAEFKNDVERALVSKFGKSDVERNDKCITIKENNYRIETDVVPTWKYRHYFENGDYVEGTTFFSDSGKQINNYPKQHIQNGITKNNDTYRKFKRLVRLHKKIRYKMDDDGVSVNKSIKSFLIESLIWNVPNNIISGYQTWTETLKQSIIYLFQNTESDEQCKNWCEVSNILYLFHSGRKWSRSDVNDYVQILWNYLEY